MRVNRYVDDLSVLFQHVKSDRIKISLVGRYIVDAMGLLLIQTTVGGSSFMVLLTGRELKQVHP